MHATFEFCRKLSTDISTRLIAYIGVWHTYVTDILWLIAGCCVPQQRSYSEEILCQRNLKRSSISSSDISYCRDTDADR